MNDVLFKYQKDGNKPIFEAKQFIELIERDEPKLKGFFDMLYEAMNPDRKNKETNTSQDSKY